MADDRWPAERDPSVVGVVVHGAAVVARSPGIAVAVRCVVAGPDGLEFDLVLRAVGVQAEAAVRQTFGDHLRGQGPGEETEGARAGSSDPELTFEVDGRRVTAHRYEQSASGGEDEFTSELRVAVAELPSDGLVTLGAAWPQAGLAEGSVTLTLAPLDDLESRVIRLPS